MGFLLFSYLWGSDETQMKQFQKEAEKFAKEKAEFALDQAKNFSMKGIVSNTVKPFDPNKAQEQMKTEKIENIDTLDFIISENVQINLRDNKNFSKDEYFFKNSEAIDSSNIEEQIEELEKEFYLETCQESAGPYPVIFIRTLEVDALYEPEERIQYRICNGHKIKKELASQSRAEKWYRKKKDELAADSTIKKYNIQQDGCVVRMEWRHINNASSCDCFSIHEDVKPELWEENGERWAYDKEDFLSFAQNPNCTLIEKSCLDTSPKNIQGKQVQKQCWKEKLCYLCQFPKIKGCSFLRDKNCIEVKRQCLNSSDYGCALWEITYKCFDKIKMTSKSPEGMYYEMEVNTAYIPNQSFAAVFTKMKVFEEMKNQLEFLNADDASNIQLFHGKKKQCTKSVAENILYDCCFSFGGLAKELKLSQCTEEEIELGMLREKDLCHYIGKYEKHFLDLWKSQNVHVYCCFPSKLSRIFQEEAREQLGLNWGDPEKPNCRGLLPEEIAKVDFSQLDLSELYDKKSVDIEEKLQQKLDALQQDLKFKNVEPQSQLRGQINA
jgi:conjugal transfer mating pair stabilization protein TraN